MLTIKLSFRKQGGDDVDGLIRAIPLVTPALLETAVDMVHGIVADVFTGEGASEFTPMPWAPLARSTIDDRLMLGFAEGPILERTGSLIGAMTEEGADGHIVERSLSGAGSGKVRIGTTDFRFAAHQTGTPTNSKWLPKRVIWPEDEGRTNALEAISSEVMETATRLLNGR